MCRWLVTEQSDFVQFYHVYWYIKAVMRIKLRHVEEFELTNYFQLFALLREFRIKHEMFVNVTRRNISKYLNTFYDSKVSRDYHICVIAKSNFFPFLTFIYISLHTVNKTLSCFLLPFSLLISDSIKFVVHVVYELWITW